MPMAPLTGNFRNFKEKSVPGPQENAVRIVRMADSGHYADTLMRTPAEYSMICGSCAIRPIL